MNETKLSQLAIGTAPMSTESTPATASTIDSKASEFWTVILLGLFLGVFGAHRFYARKFKSGIVQLFTFGGLGIWSFIDVIVILLSKFKNSTGVVYRNPKPKVAWGVFAAVCILGFISAASDKQTGSGSSRGGSHSSYSGSSHKSARQLIRDRAESLYGRNADVTIDSGYAGGAYTVTISDHENFHTYTYAVKVDEAAQDITLWELGAND